MLGKHIEKFTKDCEQILDFINNKMMDDKHDDFLQGVKGCLKLWPKIYSFVREANVGSDYLLDIQNYKDNCVEYYTYAGKSFMKTGKESTKTFYMHAMRCYVPQIAIETYNLFNCGYGFWSMQACERRNYESKTTWHHHTNKKETNNTSRLQQVLKKQYDNFRSGWMKYKTGLKAFPKKRRNKKKTNKSM